MSSEETVRRLGSADVPAADRVFRLAFGTHLGLPDPLGFSGDAALTTNQTGITATTAIGTMSLRGS